MSTSAVAEKRPRGNPNWRKGGESPNPRGRASRADAARVDGWINALSGFGVQGKDPRLGASAGVNFSADVVTDYEAQQLWSGDDIGKRIVEDLPNEAMRQGVDVKLETKEESEAVSHRLKESGALAAFTMALKYRRAYGGAALLPVINDGSLLLSTPLNENRITKITAVHVFEPRELQPLAWYSDPNHPKFRRPSLWKLTPTSPSGDFQSSVIHESRLVIFRGMHVNGDGLGAPRQGWDHSVFTPIVRVLRDYHTAWDATGKLVGEFSQVIWKIRDLAEMISAEDGRFVNRIRGAELARSVMNALVVDTENEGYERQSVNVTGLPDLLDRFASRLAAAADMPLTRLMGDSPGGLGSNGEGETRSWYDAVKREQKRAETEMEQLVRLFLLEIDGATHGKIPKTWSVTWCPLWQPSEKEIADTRKTEMETAIAAIEHQIVTPEEVRNSMFGGDEYSAHIQIDAANDEVLAPPSPEEAATLRDPSAGAAPAGTPGLEPAKQAFTGVQVTALIDVVKAVVNGEIPRESGAAIIALAFPVDVAQAAALLGPKDFEPTKAPEPPNPFGGPKPPAPGAPPPEKTSEPPAEPGAKPAPPRADAIRTDMIEKRGAKWVVLSMSGEVLGEHDTEPEAKAQLAAIEAAKHARK